METIMNVNDVKKELMKSKVNAKFSHYVSGNLYYTVELSDGVYQFPMSVIEKVDLNGVAPKGVYNESESYSGYEPFSETLMVEKEDVEKHDLSNKENFEELKFDKLSSDLGTTSFYNEMRGSELNRWIAKAIDKNEFIKIG
jgi:hypothetical protein